MVAFAELAPRVLLEDNVGGVAVLVGQIAHASGRGVGDAGRLVELARKIHSLDLEEQQMLQYVIRRISPWNKSRGDQRRRDHKREERKPTKAEFECQCEVRSAYNKAWKAKRMVTVCGYVGDPLWPTRSLPQGLPESPAAFGQVLRPWRPMLTARFGGTTTCVIV